MIDIMLLLHAHPEVPFPLPIQNYKLIIIIVGIDLINMICLVPTLIMNINIFVPIFDSSIFFKPLDNSFKCERIRIFKIWVSGIDRCENIVHIDH